MFHDIVHEMWRLSATHVKPNAKFLRAGEHASLLLLAYRFSEVRSFEEYTMTASIVKSHASYPQYRPLSFHKN